MVDSSNTSSQHLHEDELQIIERRSQEEVGGALVGPQEATEVVRSEAAEASMGGLALSCSSSGQAPGSEELLEDKAVEIVEEREVDSAWPSASAPLARICSTGIVQKGGLYQMRRAHNLSESWIYVRTRSSVFVNQWRYFDVMNRVWAPRLPEIPYIAAELALRAQQGSHVDSPVSEMNKVRGLASAAVGPRIYVFGGWREGGPSLTDMFCYDAISERWSRRASMPTPRCYMATAVVGSKIYVAGGMTRPRLHQSELLLSADVYDTELDQWQSLPDMPFAMFFSCAVEIGGRVFVSGSRPPLDRGPAGRGCIWDPQSKAWAPMFEKKLGDVMLSPCASVGPWLFAVSTGGIQAWDSRTETWHTLPVLLEDEKAAGSVPASLTSEDIARLFSSRPAVETVVTEGLVVKAVLVEADGASAQKQLLGSALKDCVFLGRLECTDGCQMVLLHRSGAITKVCIGFADDVRRSSQDGEHTSSLRGLGCLEAKYNPGGALSSSMNTCDWRNGQPFVAQVARLSIAPPLEDEQPLDMAIVTL